jgi:MFS superfamily sulfate permease-like transporter
MPHLSDRWAAILTACLLAFYLARFNPWRACYRNDPNGRSWMTVITIVVAVFGVVLAVAWLLQLGRIIKLVGWLAAMPAVLTVMSLVIERFTNWKRRG